MGAVQLKVMRAAQLFVMVTLQFYEWELDRFLSSSFVGDSSSTVV
jgi:hypothetical protein